MTTDVATERATGQIAAEGTAQEPDASPGDTLAPPRELASGLIDAPLQERETRQQDALDWPGPTICEIPEILDIVTLGSALS